MPPTSGEEPHDAHRQTRANRLSGLGAFNGIAAGVLVGAAIGLVAGSTRRVAPAGIVAGAGAMALSDGTMALLGVSDPRTWSATDWASDIAPHLAYGLATAATLRATGP